jgi:hypothetical protein
MKYKASRAYLRCLNSIQQAQSSPVSVHSISHPTIFNPPAISTTSPIQNAFQHPPPTTFRSLQHYRAPTPGSVVDLKSRVAERLVCSDDRKDLENLPHNSYNPFSQEWHDLEMLKRERDEVCKMEEYCEDSKSVGLCNAMCSLGCPHFGGDQSCQQNCSDGCCAFRCFRSAGLTGLTTCSRAILLGQGRGVCAAEARGQ